MAAQQKNHRQTVDAARRNWQAEVETAQTYRDLAERERDEKRKGILIRMAEAEERHAQRWEATLRDLGAETPVYANTIGRRLNWASSESGRARYRASKASMATAWVHSSWIRSSPRP